MLIDTIIFGGCDPSDMVVCINLKPEVFTMPKHDYWQCDCDDCLDKREDAVDRWLSEAPEREQRERERLDAEDYYDNQDHC